MKKFTNSEAPETILTSMMLNQAQPFTHSHVHMHIHGNLIHALALVIPICVTRLFACPLHVRL